MINFLPFSSVKVAPEICRKGHMLYSPNSWSTARSLLLGWALIAAAALQGCAMPPVQGSQREIRVDTVVGKVEGVYEQEYDGVYVLRTGVRPTATQTLYAHVFFTVPLDDGRTSTMVRINAKQGIQRGDLVAFQVAQVIDESSHNSPAKSQVSAVVAKRDTPYAANYGRKAIVGAPSESIVVQNNGSIQVSSRGQVLGQFLH
jgi:hypothetical protein